MDQPKDTTQDLGVIAPPVAAPSPARRAGHRTFIAGVILGVATYIIGLSASILSDEGNVFESQPAQIFGAIGLVTLISLSGALISAGSNARQFQKQLDEELAPLRKVVADLVRGVDANRILLERLTLDTRERDETKLGIVAVLPGRVNENGERIGDLSGSISELVKVVEDIQGRMKRVEQVVAPEAGGYVQGLEHGMQLRRDAFGNNG